MSRLHEEQFACAHCGKPLQMGVIASINADRRPDLRQRVLDGSLQRGQCEACGTPFRLQPQLTYLDAKRHQWILVQPGDALADWPVLEAAARQGFDRAYGEEAPPDARALGEAMRSRVVFGWAALREKLLCAELGLDDVTLELVKLAVIRAVDEVPLADDHALRLADADAESLTLVWTPAGSDRGLEALTVPRALYAEIAADAGGVWAALREEIAAGPFVDVDRILVPAEGDAEAEAEA